MIEDTDAYKNFVLPRGASTHQRQESAKPIAKPEQPEKCYPANGVHKKDGYTPKMAATKVLASIDQYPQGFTISQLAKDHWSEFKKVWGDYAKRKDAYNAIMRELKPMVAAGEVVRFRQSRGNDGGDAYVKSNASPQLELAQKLEQELLDTPEPEQAQHLAEELTAETDPLIRAIHAADEQIQALKRLIGANRMPRIRNRLQVIDVVDDILPICNEMFHHILEQLREDLMAMGE